jgi:hypothetical protein
MRTGRRHLHDPTLAQARCRAPPPGHLGGRAPDARPSPILHHPNKQLVYQIACPPAAPHRGTIGFTRWAAMPLPETAHLAHAAELVEVRE